MNWQAIKETYVQNHISQKGRLKELRIEALHRVEEKMVTHFPAFFNDPMLLTGIEKKSMTNFISIHKKQGNLSRIEASVLDDIYMIIKSI